MAQINFTGSLPIGVTVCSFSRAIFKFLTLLFIQGKDVIVALCGLFNKDEVLNHAIEFTGSEETLRTLSIDSRLTISNMTTEFGGYS